jgi:hypothetical protein
MERFVEARKLFVDAIRSDPACGAGPRVGLALCLHRMGHMEAAYKAAYSAMRTDRQLVDARALFAILALQMHPVLPRAWATDAAPAVIDPESDPNYVRILRLLQEGFETKEPHPTIALHLARM